jgi:hypothetical protein
LTALAAWIRGLPQRYGKRTLIALAAIALLGLAVRAYVVVNPVQNPADDSHAYYALSKALYEEGSFGGPEFRDSSDWSPGAPFLYATAFYATGGAREGTARIVEALLGVATILVVFALGWRLGGRWAGLFAAFAVAVYPPFIHTTGELMSEPPAMLTLPAAILAFLWAGERRSPWAWTVPGLLFGLTAMFRPEYLLVAAAFVILAFVRSSWGGGGAPPRATAPRPNPATSAGVGGGGRRRRGCWPLRSCCRSCLGLFATWWLWTGWCRSPPAAARRSTSAPSSPPTANTSG